MDIVVGTYAAYLSISIGLTVWVAKTLSKSGRLFLVDVFSGNKELADAVNHLLVVGFYLINLGYIAMALKLGYNIYTLRESVESLSLKIGVVLLVLGGMHFLNMIVFGWMRKGCIESQDPQPPVLPDGYTTFGVQ